MPTGLKRIYGQGDLHFITFSCYRRLPLLNDGHSRDTCLRELSLLRTEMNFRVVGYVIRPEHVHLLVSEPQPETPSALIQKLKQRASRTIHKNASNGGTPVKPQASFWETRFYDFNVYSTGERKEKLNYMHANPVIRGLVKHAKDWPRSSWSFYMKDDPGLVPIDVEQ
jgi:putative transposase